MKSMEFRMKLMEFRAKLMEFRAKLSYYLLEGNLIGLKRLCIFESLLDKRIRKNDKWNNRMNINGSVTVCESHQFNETARR